MRPIILKDKCPRQTVTEKTGIPDYEFEAVKKGYNKLRSNTKVTEDFENGPPVTYTEERGHCRRESDNDYDEDLYTSVDATSV